MEDEIIQAMGELSSLMGKKEIIALIYNPYKEGIEERDRISLKSLMSENVHTSPLFLLSGQGGSFSTGVKFPHIIKQSVKTYKVYVPSVCASALGFMIFLADELLISEKTKILQLDPLMLQEDGQRLRAVDYMNNLVKDEVRDKSKEAFNATRDQLVKFCEDSKLFAFRSWKRGEYGFRDHLEAVFMKKSTHDDPITTKELDLLEVNYFLMEDPKKEKVAFKLIKLCRDYLIRTDSRVVFVSSNPMKIRTKEGLQETEGIFTD